MAPKDYFSENYSTARSRFRDAAAAAGATLHSLPLDAQGPDSEELTIDIALLGSENPERVLLHSCGLHGVEGFAGSAIQLSLLENPPEIPESSALVMVHPLNPYGMAWKRRVNESNVDLNRNFLAPNEPYEGSTEGYRLVNPLMNRPKVPSVFDFFMLRTLHLIGKHGFNNLKQAVVGGQYDFPKGLFFGGAELEQGPRLYLDWLAQHLSNAQHVVVIDIHTGLGKMGGDTLLVESQVGEPLYERLHKKFGDRVAPWDPEESVAYEIRGGLPQALARQFPNAQVDFVTQEFGTYPPLKVLKALALENRHVQWSETDIPLEHPSKKFLLEMFRPDSDSWRQAICQRGNELFRQARELAFS
ncbi:MAG: DUF2817 domain-containing protein [Myxococcota bacterium]|nr:DUF2817 domain-containing protein [Myxococcota bacterium]